MDLWQKLLVEWPLQVWRQLWAGLPRSALLEKLTWQRVVFIAVLLVAVAAFVQIVSLDMAFLMAGDVALYCEIAAAVMFVVVRGHIRYIAHTAKAALKHAACRVSGSCRRSIGTRHRRSTGHPARDDTSADDDGAASWLPGLGGYPAAV